MKIDNVEDLLVDILGVPEHAITEAKGWLEITVMFEKAISSANDLLLLILRPLVMRVASHIYRFVMRMMAL